MPPARSKLAEDVCTPTLARRVAALLDRDPDAIREGDPLPRGWHVALFTVSTPQSRLRADGVGGLGFTLPPSELPRLVAGGRRVRFLGDIRVGSRLTRESRIVSVLDKQGRSGPLRLFTVRHRIAAAGAADPVLEEEQDYIMRAAETAAPARDSAGPAASDAAPPEAAAGTRHAVLFDEAMLFRYCAITFNAHRIHYDKDWAQKVEGYPGLLVNAGLSGLFLLEAVKAAAGEAVRTLTLRNLAPLFCGEEACIQVEPSGGEWRLRLESASGRRVLEGTATA